MVSSSLIFIYCMDVLWNSVGVHALRADDKGTAMEDRSACCRRDGHPHAVVVIGLCWRKIDPEPQVEILIQHYILGCHATTPTKGCDSSPTLFSAYNPRGIPSRDVLFLTLCLQVAYRFFFTENLAYTEYKWHLPHNRSSYSVYIPEESVQSTANLSIEQHLLSLSIEQHLLSLSSNE